MRIRAAVFTLSIALLAQTLPAAAPADPRIALPMSPAEKAEFLSEMRQMLASIQGIIEGIAEEDREKIAKAARYSGNRMARATPDALRQRLPVEFQELGGPTHMMFEEMVIRAPDDDMQTLTEFTGELMQQCLACHARYRAD